MIAENKDELEDTKQTIKTLLKSLRPNSCESEEEEPSDSSFEF